MHNGPQIDEYGTIVCDTPESIQLFQLLSIKGRLKLEISGLRFRVSTLPAVNRTFNQNFPRSRHGKEQALEFIQGKIDELTEPLIKDPA